MQSVARPKDTIFGLLVTVLVAFVLLSLGALVFEIYQIVKSKRGVYVVDEEAPGPSWVDGWRVGLGICGKEDRVAYCRGWSRWFCFSPQSFHHHQQGRWRGGDEYVLMTVE